MSATSRSSTGRCPASSTSAAAAKLLRSARADTDPLARLVTELLARTGMRRGELLALSVDAVVQIGSAFWLRIPVGKLHNDRYIPLHPQLKELLDDWVTNHRPAGLRSDRLLVERNRPLTGYRVSQILHDQATAAGIDHVTAHQLRHTLATQAINRGMSLDAIAALLGHKTLAMTMVYARIADKTVADEYFAVTEKVEALYDRPRHLEADDEGAEMRKLRAEMDRRMLGNGYCARPVEMDCQLRVHLRVVHLLRHDCRVSPHPSAPTGRRRQQGAGRTPEDLRGPPQPARRPGIVTTAPTAPLDTITRISTTRTTVTRASGSTLRPMSTTAGPRRSGIAAAWSSSMPTPSIPNDSSARFQLHRPSRSRRGSTNRRRRAPTHQISERSVSPRLTGAAARRA